jgi:hypothetical protein
MLRPISPRPPSGVILSPPDGRDEEEEEEDLDLREEPREELREERVN